MQALGVGRNMIYDLINDGTLRVVSWVVAPWSQGPRCAASSASHASRRRWSPGKPRPPRTVMAADLRSMASTAATRSAASVKDVACAALVRALRRLLRYRSSPARSAQSHAWGRRSRPGRPGRRHPGARCPQTTSRLACWAETAKPLMSPSSGLTPTSQRQPHLMNRCHFVLKQEPVNRLQELSH